MSQVFTSASRSHGTPGEDATLTLCDLYYTNKKWSSNIKANQYVLRTRYMNAGNKRECARLHACCMGLDKVESWIIFTWQKPWINHNCLALSHVLVLATRLALQIAAEMGCGAALLWQLAVSHHGLGLIIGHRQNSVLLIRSFHAASHLLHHVLNGLLHPICQTITPPPHTHTHRKIISEIPHRPSHAHTYLDSVSVASWQASSVIMTLLMKWDAP